MDFSWSLDEEREEWMSQAMLTLQAAEEMLLGELPGESIANSFLAMIYAARAALAGSPEEVSTWEEVIRRFRELSAESGLSLENRRALPMVAELYRRVVMVGDMEADPVTASACLDDARSFVDEVAGWMGFAAGSKDAEEEGDSWDL